MIQLFDIPNPKIDLSETDHILHSRVVNEFEEEFADYVGSKYACGTSSCTIAITLIASWLESLGDYAASFTCVPTMIPPVVPNALTHAGKTPLFCDNPDWMGGEYKLMRYVYVMDFFNVYDSAQAVVPRRVMTESKAEGSCFLYSFYPTKPVGGIDGGMVATDNEELYKWLKIATMNGTVPSVDSWDRELLFAGWKAYLSTAQATVARESLRSLNERKQKLGLIRACYNTAFGLANNSDHLYVVDVDNNVEAMKHLNNLGISTGIHYKCVHLMQPYIFTPGKFPLSEERANTVLSIPFHSRLREEQVQYVCEKVGPLLRRRG